MAIKMRFDSAKNPILPTFVLATRGGKKLGIITNISDVHVADNLNAPMDISFKTHKLLDIDPLDYPNLKYGYLAAKQSDSSDNYERIMTNDGSNIYVQAYDELNGGRTASQIWDEIINFRKVWVKDWDTWFTLTLGIDEEKETVKNISLVPNSEFELSNVNVHNLEINTESDILREDYVTPTVFYNPDKPEASLLHRVLSYTKGFEIKYVDDSLKNIQRTFALDGKNIYDTLQEIAEEIQCLFVFHSGTNSDGTIERAFSVYDLRTYCYNCGYRGDYNDVCPKCGSTNLEPPYGEDTTIFVDNEALANSISLTTDTDSVKNCFRLLSGDGLMDAAIIATNPNGSQYIWHFPDDLIQDMSPELRDRLHKYDVDYDYYENTYNIPLNSATLTAYNYLITKYKTYNPDLANINTITGYARLMNILYDVLDFQLYLESGLMPTIQMDTSAEEQAKKITSQNMPNVAVQNIRSISATTADNAVSSAMRVLVDNRYDIKINTSMFNTTMYIWTGSFTVTAKNDPTDTAESEVVSVMITSDYNTFCKQKIEKTIDQGDKNNYSIEGFFDLDYNDFVARLKMYSRAGLDSFYSAANAAIGVMVELGISNPSTAVLIEGGLNAYYDIYQPYIRKLRAIEAEIQVRDSEIAVIEEMYDKLMAEKYRINDYLDIDSYLGYQLAVELYSYKMEDDYENSNYISEGLDNAELFKHAAEYVEIANNEIRRASIQHHTISTTMHNLLTIPEFEPLVDYFEVGNWLRIRIDGKVYVVKLLSYTIDYDQIENLQVTFSDSVGSGGYDISDVFAQAQSMAKSYDSIKYQITNGTTSKRTINEWINKGLDMTTVRILGATNQTQVWDETGISMKQWDDITQEYSDFQSKFINTTLAFTTDNWETTETAVGRFDFWNPKTGNYEEGFGVIAKQLIGNLILGNEVGIYNQQGSINITDGGIVITANGDDNINNVEFLIQREYTDQYGNTQYEKQMYIDEDGKLVFNGSAVTFQTGKTLDERMQEIETETKTLKTLTIVLTNEMQLIPTDSEGNNGDFTDCKTTVYVYYGSSDVTQSAQITATPSSGVTGTWDPNTYTYTVSNMSSDSGSVQFNASFSDVTGVKSMSLTKVRAGVSGGSGRSITSSTNTYQASNSGTTAPTGEWKSTPPTVTAGQYLWTKTVYQYSDGTSSTSYSIGYIGQNGSNVSVDSTVTTYAQTSNVTQPPESAWSTTIPNVAQGNYLWTRVITKYTDGNESISLSYVRQGIDGNNGENGAPGKDGNSINSVTTSYGVSSSVSTRPESWSSSLPTSVADGDYLWVRTIIDYTDEEIPDTVTYSYSRQGKDGQKGTEGTSVTVKSIQYQAGTSATTAPTGIWSDYVVSVDDGKYLWTKTTFSDGSIAYGVARQGENGLTSYVHIKYAKVIDPKDSEMTEDPSDYIGVCVDYTEKDPTTASSYTWSKFAGTDGQNGLPGKNGYVHFAYATSANGQKDFNVNWFAGATYLGVYSDNEELDSTKYTDYKWSLIKGNDGRSISNVTNYYLASASSSGVTKKTSGWTDTIQTISESKPYLWNYEVITYSDGVNPDETSPTIIGRYGLNGKEGRGISKITEYYLATSASSGVTKNTSGWTAAVQTTTNTNRYLWNYETITYTSGTPAEESTDPRIIGTYGDAAVTYSLIVSHAAIVKSESGIYNPTSITLTAKSQTGANAMTNYSGRFKIETTTNNSTWTAAYTSSANENSKSYTIPSNIIALRCSLYLAGGTSTLLDQQTVPIVNDGKGGANGYNQATIYMFKRSAVGSVPSKPTGALTYTFSTKAISGTSSAINGWAQNMDATGSNPFWMIAATASSITDTDSIAASEWTTPVQIEGVNGSSGYNQATIYLYQRSKDAPSAPTATLTYTFSTGALSGNLGNWSTSIPSGTNPCWVTVASASSQASTDSIVSGDWSPVVKFVENGTNGTNGTNGKDGDNGYNQATIYLYQRRSSAPSKPTASATYTFSSGTLSSIPSGWSRTIPTDDGNPCWVTTAAAISQNASVSISNWTDVAKLVENGANGLNQATVYLYQRSKTSPTVPTATLTYTFSTQTLSGTLGNWSTSIPSGSDPCWIIAASASSSTDTDSIVGNDWSSVIKFVENGAGGKDGDNGYNQATIYLYQRKSSAPTKPTTSVTYTFSSGALSTVPSGWSKTIPANNGDPCWVTTAAAISQDASVSVSNWTDVVKLVEDGDDGYNQATVYLYQRKSSVPTKPAASVTYTFSTAKLSSVPSGWFTTIPANDGNPCYVTTAAVVSKEASATIASSSWSDVVKLVENGTNGLNQATVYLYQRSATAPSVPTATLTYTFSTGKLSGTLGNWSTSISSGTNPCWITVASASSSTDTDSIVTGDWSSVVKFVENGAGGKDGDNGYNQATIYLYQRKSTQPTKPTAAATYTFSSGALASIPSGWSKNIPANDGNPCWVTTAAAISREASVSVSNWTDVVKLVEDGMDGDPAYTIILTNESHTFSGDDTKAIPVSVVCGVIAYKGATQVAATIGTITGTPTGMSTTIQNNNSTTAQFTVAVTTALTTRQGVLTVPITVDGKSFSRKFSWSLALNGTDGDPTASYILEANTNVIKKSIRNVLTPGTITFSAYYREGTAAARSAYAGRFVIQESVDGSTWTTKYTSSTNQSSYTYTPSSANVLVIRCTLYAAGGTTTQLDIQSVAVISDVDGLKVGSRNLIKLSDTLNYTPWYLFIRGYLISNVGAYIVTDKNSKIYMIE